VRLKRMKKIGKSHEAGDARGDGRCVVASERIPDDDKIFYLENLQPRPIHHQNDS
jgi:hypothetical protein